MIEDDLRLARQITRELKRANHEPARGTTARKGFRMRSGDPPDLVVLDLTLPASTVCRSLPVYAKRMPTARILILTALGGVADRVEVTPERTITWPKPFSMNELMARVEALGRARRPPPVIC